MNQYIQERYNRKKMRSRISLGVQILIQKPVINLLWVVLVACVLAVVYGEGKFMSIYESESFLRESIVVDMENIIRNKRKELGLSQEELAKKCGVSRQTVNAIENNKYDPTLALAFCLAKELQITVDELFIPS